MEFKNLSIVKILFEQNDIPPERIQLAHTQIIGENHRQHDDEYALDQSKLIFNQGYFMIVFESAIPKLVSSILDRKATKFYHGNEDYKLIHLGLEYYPPDQTLLGISDQVHFYRIKNWCPFDQDEHKYFKNVLQGQEFNWMNSFLEQRQYLQNSLRNHLFALMKAFYLTTSNQHIICNFRALQRSKNRIIRHFNSETNQLEEYPMWSFDGEIACNLEIPEFMGLGRAIRYGNGVTTRIKFPNNYK